MTEKVFRALVADSLSQSQKIVNVLNADHSLLVSCDDRTGFLVNILESKQTFIHSSSESRFMEGYTATHSREEFVRELLELSESHPGFFLFFLIFGKLEELGIIDAGLYHHLNDSAVHYEKELEAFAIELLSRFMPKGA